MMGDFENTGRSGTSTMRVTEKAVCTYVSFHLTTPFPLTITLVSQSTAQLRRSDTKLEGLVVEMTRASLITHTHPHNLFLVLQWPACFPFRTLSIPIHRSSSTPLFLRFLSASIFRLCIVTTFAPDMQRTREAVEEEEPSPPRGENRVGRYDRAVFILAWRRSNEERVSDAMWMSVTNTTMSSSRHRHYLPVSAVPSAPMMTA